MSAPAILEITKLENGWLVQVDRDLCFPPLGGKRFVFNTPEELGFGISELVKTGELPPSPLAGTHLDHVDAIRDELEGMGRTD